ncbi:DUF4397 domain-containing protein [Halobacterium hubeiense]|uniref:DUF4397 domain-containing protein n=1 Tax=Halobacterium hubeiense TaxID=1407499 RepID=UPI003C766E83
MTLSGTALAAALAGCTDGGGDGDVTTQANGTTAGTTEEPTETAEETTTQSGEQAFVRAVHAAPGAPAVDVYVNDQLAFEEAPYKGVTPYAELPPGEYDVRITAAGDESTVVFDETVPVEAGYQSALAYGELGADEGSDTAFSVGLLADQSEAPGDEESLVRLFHGSPDAPAVDVTVESSGDVLFDGAAFGDTTDYASVPPGSYTLEVRPDTEDGSGDVVTTFDVTVEGGTAYSAFAVGYLELSGDQPEFDLVTTTDGPGQTEGPE